MLWRKPIRENLGLSEIDGKGATPSKLVDLRRELMSCRRRPGESAKVWSCLWCCEKVNVSDEILDMDGNSSIGILRASLDLDVCLASFCELDRTSSSS